MCREAGKVLDKAWLSLLEMEGGDAEGSCRDTVLQQARLKIGKGGDGLPNFEALAPAAHLASVGLWLAPLISRYSSALERGDFSPIWGAKLNDLCSLWDIESLAQGDELVHDEHGHQDNEPATNDGAPLERDFLPIHSVPSSSSLQSRLLDAPPSFRQLYECYRSLAPLDDGAGWPVDEYHVEQLRGSFWDNVDENQNRPLTPAFHHGFSTMASEKMPRLQRYFSRKLSDKLFEDIIRDLTRRFNENSSARLQTGETVEHALFRIERLSKSLFIGQYLNILPTTYRSLSHDQGVAVARLRYGVPQLNVSDPLRPDCFKTCSCGKDLDDQGHHQTTCPKSPWSTTARHFKLIDAIVRCLQGLPGIQGHTEVLTTPRNSQSDAQDPELRADLTIFEGLEGDNKPLHLDVTIVTPGRVNAAENLKNNKHLGPCTRAGAKFLALVFDMFGFSGAGFSIFLDLVMQAAHKHGYSKEVWASLKVPRLRVKNFLLRELSWALIYSSAGMLVSKARAGSYRQGPVPGLSSAHTSSPTAGDGTAPVATTADRRTTKTPEQLAVLNEAFNVNPTPGSRRYTELAQRLGLQPRQVQVWFQYQRRRRANSGRAASAAPATAPPPFQASPPLLGASPTSSPPPASTPSRPTRRPTHCRPTQPFRFPSLRSPSLPAIPENENEILENENETPEGNVVMSEEERVRVRLECHDVREALLRAVREPRLRPASESPDQAGTELAQNNQSTQVQRQLDLCGSPLGGPESV